MATRKRLILQRQLEHKATSYRATVLAAVNTAGAWSTGRRIAELAGLSYKQTIDALDALHNNGKVARRGRTSGALWGSLALAKTANPTLDPLFQFFFAGKPKSNS